jgi:hypothetical protein
MGTKLASLVAVVLATASLANAAELDQQTLRAWDAYVQAATVEMQNRGKGTAPFLWIDQVSGRREAVRRGEVLAEPTHTQSPQELAHGSVYDWTGAIFIPNTTIQQIFTVLNQFDRYDEFYNPVVVRAKLLEDLGRSQRFSVTVLEKEPFVSTAFESEYLSRTTCLDRTRCYNIIYSTRIQQIADYQRPSAHKLPPDQGCVWRLFSIQKFEEGDGGVYSELEAIALTQDVPFEIRWLIKPLLERLPRNSMVGTLEKTRNAVCQSNKRPD